MKKPYVLAIALLLAFGCLFYYFLFYLKITSKNIGMTAGVPVGPTISPDGGRFHGGIKVAITKGAGATETHFSENAENPDCSDSHIYTAPFSVISDTVVRAVDCGPGGQSTVITASFTFATSSGGGNTTNNPTEVPGGPECDSAHPELCPPDAPTNATAGNLPDVPTFGNVIGSSPSHLYRNITLGSQGEDVQFLQQFLIKNGQSSSELARVGATGYFGQLTKNAVIEFQNAEHIIPAAGFVGPITIGKINARLGLLPR